MNIDLGLVDVDRMFDPARVVEAAAALCENPAKPAWVAEATNVLQLWMNRAYLSQADAVRSLAVRADTAGFAAQKAQLCKALEISPEIAAQEKTFADATRELFGCISNRGFAELWTHPESDNPGGVLYRVLPDVPHVGDDQDRHDDRARARRAGGRGGARAGSVLRLDRGQPRRRAQPRRRHGRADPVEASGEREGRRAGAGGAGE